MVRKGVAMVLMVVVFSRCTYKWGYPEESDPGPDAGIDANNSE